MRFSEIRSGIRNVIWKGFWEIRNEINIMFTKDQEIRDLADKNRFNIFKIRKLNKQFEELDRKLVLLIELPKVQRDYAVSAAHSRCPDCWSLHPI